MTVFCYRFSFSLFVSHCRRSMSTTNKRSATIDLDADDDDDDDDDRRAEESDGAVVLPDIRNVDVSKAQTKADDKVKFS
jgi:hypothetical protein